MDEISPLAEFLGQVIYHFTLIKPLLPTYGHLLLSAIFPIYIGAHASLAKPPSAAKPLKKTQDSEYDSDDDEAEEENKSDGHKMEGLAPSDALIFPLTAGLTLGGLYLFIKYKGAETLNKILGYYFSQMGLFFAIAFLKDFLSVVRSFVFPRRYSSSGKVWKQKPSAYAFIAAKRDPNSPEPADARPSPFPGIFSRIPLPDAARTGIWKARSAIYWRARLRVHVHRLVRGEMWLDMLDLISTVVALPAIGYFTFVTKPWWLTNFLGFSFCYGTLQFMSPTTFVTGSLILGSLFFYDIYFVYFTPLMVTVAKTLDVPIKLLFPRPPVSGEAPDTISLAMLGLGDIIIPGMMVGLALRFDLYFYYKRKGLQKARVEGNGVEFIKPVYQPATGSWGERFWTCVVAPKKPELQPPYHDARSFPKTYFKASVVGYLVGMVATLVVMQIFDHPQPALLYLVPGVLISLWGTALVRNEIGEMWEFSEEDEDDNEEEEETDNKKEQNEHQENQGFFSRILSLYKNTDNAPRETSAEKHKETDADDDDKESSASSAKEEEVKDVELFTVSLFYPHKAKTRKQKSPALSSKSSAADEENWSVVGAEGDSEPPTKRRRRSPRHADANGS
ncbi:aspartic endopeptidase [Aspergillus saccharolyticus JOP 1030-1]|uniref:Signal peptide peptidase n=1 Tax=Aspergillus saccharolyticus JOP 1030-1 TaxID=1450539 RepID=A0A318ZLQ3_9EURO|nr:hypothetical protein BP01DRAFT_356903 [Aspergillus saccharolyticus JOP 1030-1]PYH45393.1 hypothetical protein BP01DRAFT_356903 [Aspergillus saccharolyticus JOP 1030-1]